MGVGAFVLGLSQTSKTKKDEKIHSSVLYYALILYTLLPKTFHCIEFIFMPNKMNPVTSVYYKHLDIGILFCYLYTN